MIQAAILKQARESARMSQAHLASAAGVSKRTVIRAEQGASIQDESLRCLCSVLGLDAATLPTSVPLPEPATPRSLLREHITRRGEAVVWEGAPDAEAWRRKTWYRGHRALHHVLYLAAAGSLILYGLSLDKDAPVASLDPWLCIGGMLASAFAAHRVLIRTSDLRHTNSRLANSLHALTDDAFYTARLGRFSPDVVVSIERIPLPEDRRQCRVKPKTLAWPMARSIRLNDNALDNWRAVHVEGIPDLPGLARLMRGEATQIAA